MNRRTGFAAAMVALGLGFAGPAAAQDYPSRAITLIVPYPAGGGVDAMARIVGEKLSAALGQQVVVDNRGGGGGNIGTRAVAKSPPDGYTLLASSSGPISIMPNVQKTPYDPLKDFAAVSLIAAAPFALVTHPSFPASDAREFIAHVRANPDKYAFSSSGTGATAHMITELFNSMADITARHVPYKGTAPALTDIMNGQIAYTIETVAATVAHVKSGRLKALGVSFARRSAAMPEVPPLAEAANLPGFDVGAWIGYSAPAGTPREVLARLSGEIQKAMQAQDLRERYLALGLDPVANTPDEMMAFLRTEQARYGEIVRKANIKVE